MSKPCDNCGSDLRVCKDCDLYTGKYTKAEIKTELEKIMEYAAEASILRDNLYDHTTEYSVSLRDLRNIIDKRISELKNEENE